MKTDLKTKRDVCWFSFLVTTFFALLMSQSCIRTNESTVAYNKGLHALNRQDYDLAITEFSSPRAWAFALLGINEYLRAFQGDSSVQAVRKALAERLLNLFRKTSREDCGFGHIRVL